MDFPYWRGRGTSRGMRGSARGMRGSARGRSSNTPQREVRLGFKTLENMQDKTPDEITLDLTSSRCFPATEYLLNAQESMTDDTIFLLVKILARASGSDARESVLKLLNVLPQSMFFTIHLSSYLSRIPLHTRPPLSPDRLEVALKNLIKLLAKLMEVNPSCYPFLPLLALSCVVTMQCDDGTLDVDIKSRVQNLMKLRDEKVEELERKEEEKKRSRQHPRDPGIHMRLLYGIMWCFGFLIRKRNHEFCVLSPVRCGPNMGLNPLYDYYGPELSVAAVLLAELQVRSSSVK